MGRQPLLLMICIANGLVLFADAESMDVRYGPTNSSITLTCPYKYKVSATQIRWYRNNTFTLKTKWKFFRSPTLEYELSGQDLKAEDMVKLIDWYKIEIRILPESVGTVWHCCQYKGFYTSGCSDSIKIGTNDTSTSDRNTSPRTPDEDIKLNGTDGTSSGTPTSTTPDEGSASPAPQDAGNTSAATQDSDTASPATQDAGNTSATTQDAVTQATLPPAVSLSSVDGMLPIIAGTLCGVISLLVITVTIVLYRRRNIKSKDAEESGGLKTNAREEIVMEDNELYDGGTFDYSADAQKKETVMEDNELYEGGTFDYTVEAKKKEIVMVHNDVYEGGTMKDQGKENSDIEMQMNEIYSSSP